MKLILLLKIILLSFLFKGGFAQPHYPVKKRTFVNKSPKKGIVRYGTASYYADKFHVRQTATGEKYDH